MMSSNLTTLAQRTNTKPDSRPPAIPVEDLLAKHSHATQTIRRSQQLHIPSHFVQRGRLRPQPSA